MPEPPMPKMTIPTQLVLRALLRDPSRSMYGLEICQEAGLASGTIHPILARLEGYGWIESQFEEVEPSKVGRPRRRYYRLSADGAEQARLAMARARARLTMPQGFRPGLALGGIE